MFSPKKMKTFTLTELFRTGKSDSVILTAPAPLICVRTGKPIGGIIAASERRGR